MNGEKPRCIKCAYYFVTYDPTRPKGCKKFNFISAKLPSVLIKEETGEECLAFKERNKKTKGLDLNDPSLW